jgi:asparagine synthase (glutamine-hydrolysing)
MCGLVAILNHKKIPVDIGNMLNKIQHRGPDDRGWMTFDGGQLEYGRLGKTIDSSVALGHVRLSILDLSEAGWQPMQACDNRYAIVFNGEIYNYVELRNELRGLGYDFKSESDTEVLLAALIEWGSESIARLRGMFAFVFYDQLTNKLLVARDYFGIKPLFWCRWQGGLAFSSEVGPLLTLPGVSQCYSPQAVYDYLLTGISGHGTQSMYRDLQLLPAASFMELDTKSECSGSLNVTRYWSIDFNKKITPSFEEAVQRVRELFLESVALHMRSDVPVGAALSGGVDSSSIVCAIRYLYPNQEIHTFSFIADEEGLSEENWIDVVNTHANCIAHKVKATNTDLVSSLDDLIHAQGEPFGSTSIYAQYKVFEKAKEHGIKVILDGQGADEMLAGYVSYQGSRLVSLLLSGNFIQAFNFIRAANHWPGRSSRQVMYMAGRELLPTIFRRVMRAFLSKNIPPNWISENWLVDSNVDPRPAFLHGTSGRDRLRSSLLETMFVTSVPHLLRYEDRNSMRFSVESRVPFLHVDLVEYLYSLPEEYLISSDGCSKYVFREAMRGIVPDSILDRRDKVGFATPERSWLSQMNTWVESNLAYADHVDCLHAGILKQEWNDVMGGKVAFNSTCWRWLNFLVWEKSKAGNA